VEAIIKNMKTISAEVKKMKGKMEWLN
jgi:hypothetical protein